jgi:hypothetical protein
LARRVREQKHPTEEHQASVEEIPADSV